MEGRGGPCKTPEASTDEHDMGYSDLVLMSYIRLMLFEQLAWVLMLIVVVRHTIPGPRCRRRRCLWYRLLCRPPTKRSQGCHQEDCSIRPLNVLFTNTARAQVT